MAGLTLDTPLIGAERGDWAFWAFFKEASCREVVPVIPAPVLARAWPGPRQARLARVVNARFVEPEPWLGPRDSLFPPW